jgi:hypothetical protein
MSAELIQRLASSGMNMRQAAESQGMPFWKFRKLREMYPEIKWGLSKARRNGLTARHKLTAEQVDAIRADNRHPKVIADKYGVHRTAIYNIKARRTWP